MMARGMQPVQVGHRVRIIDLWDAEATDEAFGRRVDIGETGVVTEVDADIGDRGVVTATFIVTLDNGGQQGRLLRGEVVREWS